MKGNYEPDTFTENDVFSALEMAGLRYKNGNRYILSQCPTHEDENPSVQIYKDDWFVNCHAGCGRYHITKAFPSLRGNSYVEPSKDMAQPVRRKKELEVKYKTFDLMEQWQKMSLIPRDHVFKNIPLQVLDELGWRWDEAKNSYFIPYFSRSKESVPFAQWRHLSGERRFTFLKDAKPTCYGTWNLEPGEKLFVVEGTSDCAVLDFCAIPWIGLPSAASVELIKQMGKWCMDNKIELVYAGDNDAAGDKLKEALDEVADYRECQPPKKYKDWGDFFVAEGLDVVQDYCSAELYGEPIYPRKPDNWDELNDVQKVQTVFPGGEQLEIV